LSSKINLDREKQNDTAPNRLSTQNESSKITNRFNNTSRRLRI
jgi:hypothetical protein